VDDFVEYYTGVRPHPALGRRTPEQAFGARKKALPSRRPLALPPHCRVRQDKVNNGK
jgi:hypothetical protein